MNRKLVLALALTLLIGMLNVTFNIQPVESDYPWTETIYIRADGSVYPNTAPISSVDNVTYTLTDNIVADSIPSGQSIIAIERDSIVFDGVGCTLQGTENGNGIYLYGRTNVTIKNIHIKNFWHGIYLDSSSHNSLSGNNITNNRVGIAFVYSSSNNSVSGNNITANTDNGIWLGSSSNNSITGNNITNNGLGIGLGSSPNNSVSGNNITGNNEHGIYLSYSSATSVAENDIINNYNGIFLYYSSNTSVSGNNITNNDYGISLDGSSNNSVQGNSITNNDQGINFWQDCSNNTIFGNNITANNGIGIDLEYSSHNTISGNNLINNSFAIDLWYSSHCTLSGNYIAENYGDCCMRSYRSENNTIEQNTIVNNLGGLKPALWLDGSSSNYVINNVLARNFYGIHIEGGGRNIIFGNTITEITQSLGGAIWLYDSNDNKIYGNTIKNNTLAIQLAGSNNTIFHNDFINNTQQVSAWGVNMWDDGFEGNYWSNYTGVDSNHDGIGDTEHVIDANNIDHRPLMGMFSCFNASLGEYVNVISNSTIEELYYFESNRTIKMFVSGEGFGFCRVCVPHALMNETYSVIINGTDILPYYVDVELYDNNTHRWIFVSYKHSTLEIDIIPEFPSILTLSLFMIITLLIVIVYRRKHTL